MSSRGRGGGRAGRGNAQGGVKTELVNAAVNSGINQLIKNHPGLSGNYLRYHIDQGKLRKALSHTYQDIHNQRGNIPRGGMEQALYGAIHEYTARGAILDDNAQKVILLQGIREKPGFLEKITSIIPGRKKPQDVNNVMRAMNDLYHLIENGDYSKNLESFANAVTTIKDMQVVGPAIDILRSYDLLNDGSYSAIKKALRKKVTDATYQTVDMVKTYAQDAEMKQAAAILSVSGGVILAASAVNMTGNVVASGGSLSLKVIELCLGLGFLDSGIWLFKKYSKEPRKVSKKTVKKKKRR